jgi:hypothetical protein
MRTVRSTALSLALTLVACAVVSGTSAHGQQPEQAKLDASKMPHVAVDVKAKQVRVECEAVNAQMPLEFFLCQSGTAEHEAVLRSPAKASHIHLGLLMLGLQPGEPVKFSKAADKWLPPHGPPLQLFCEWAGKDGKTLRVPAYRMMRNVKTKKPMPVTTWIFAGSRVMEDGKYAADTTGYLVSVVNFDLTLIDVPELATNANEALEWEVNPDLVPEKGTKVWMIIEPAGKDNAAAAQVNAGGTALAAPPVTGNSGGGQVADAGKPGEQPLSDVQIDEQKVKKLKARWEEVVKPRSDALRLAAQRHYDVINELRREQNRLIDEADRIQRVIDELQKDYQDMTTPRPEGESKQPAPEK